MNKEILEDLIKKGLTEAEIASTLHTTRSRVHQHLRKYNLKTNYVVMLATNEGKINQIKECIDNGLTTQQIADKFAMTHHQIRNLVRKFKLKLNHLKMYNPEWHKSFDWDAINKDFKNGCSIEGLYNKHKVTGYRLKLAKKMGLFCELTDAEKDSKRRVWGKKGISKSEKYFSDKLQNTNFIRYKTIGTYCLDFYDSIRNIDLEIDGKQHEDEPHFSKDIIRNKFLTEKGLTVIRINWDFFVRLSENDKYMLLYNIVYNHEKLINDFVVKIIKPDSIF